MDITIRQPLYFSEIGRKDNQEDIIYPQSLTKKQRFFILCDGMGGHDNGEVASTTVSQAMGHYFESHQMPEGVASEEYFNKALSFAYDALDAKDNPDSVKKMGTTMTCVILHKGGYLVAHIGDSRIYHIRPTVVSKDNLGILYQSSDHSLVNSLLKAGEITEEEARTFPQKNVITRAMQPCQETRAKADVYNFTDIEGGDYLFMCCDGVLENLTNECLSEILSDKALDDKAKIAAIKAECDGKTRDNYTCILIPIDKVKGAVEPSDESLVIIADVESDNPTEHPDKALVTTNNSTKTRDAKFSEFRISLKTIIAVVALFVAVLLLIMIKHSTGEKKVEPKHISMELPVDNK